MVFDVMTRIGKNAAGKDIFNVYRVHDVILSKYLREAQDCGKYIVSVIPLFRSKRKDEIVIKDESAFNCNVQVLGSKLMDKELAIEEALDTINGYPLSNDFDGF